MKVFKFIIILLLVSAGVTAHEIQIVGDPNEIYKMKNVDFLIDSSNALTIDDITNFNIYYTKNSHFTGLQKDRSTWLILHYEVGEKVDQMALIIDQANLDSVELFTKKPNGEWSTLLYGNNLPFSDRKYKTTHLIFEIPSQKQEHTIYLRLRNSVTTSFNLAIGEKSHVLAYENKANILFAFIFGIIAVMIMYNLVLYVSIKETVYLVYVLQTLFTGILQATLLGFSYQFLWPNYPVFQDYAIELFTIVATVSGLCFMSYFLKTEKYTPVFHKVTKYIIGVYSFMMLLLIYDASVVNTLLLVLQPFISLFILTTAVIVVMKGYTPAKFYLFAWTMFLLGIIVFVLAEVDIIERTIFTTLSLLIGTAVEVILLSFALAYRISLLISEKQESVDLNLKLEVEKAELIREQNLKLEKLVSERTHQLNETNEELAVRNTEVEQAYVVLKNAQSQLVNSEKMSSLGVLTAGIAHEINNPINFVKSNIGPLKQDLQEMVTFFEAAKEITIKSLPAQGLAEIKELEDQVDFDYLKIEINQLLDGITDGANRTVEIINGLRLFSRLDESDLKPVNLEEGINSTLVLLNNSYKHQLKVTTKFANIPKVVCHGGKMNQVFMNIMSNAIHSVLSSGKENGEVIIATEQVGSNVEIRFKDNGLGMTDEVKNKLFEPFFTTKDVGEGVGLGLSIVYTIIQKSNGKIEVDSELEKGTEFIITLPITTQTTNL